LADKGWVVTPFRFAVSLFATFRLSRGGGGQHNLISFYSSDSPDSDLARPLVVFLELQPNPFKP